MGLIREKSTYPSSWLRSALASVLALARAEYLQTFHYAPAFSNLGSIPPLGHQGTEATLEQLGYNVPNTASLGVVCQV